MDNRVKRKLAEGQSVEVNGISIRTPSCYDISDHGALVVMDEGDVESVECTVYVFDDDLTNTLKRSLPAAPAACSIHPSGLFAVVGTLKPDDSLYALDVDDGNERWSRSNHANEPYPQKRPQITDLEIDEMGRVTVYKTGIEACHLTAEGELVEQDQNEREVFRLLDEGAEEAVARVKSYLNDSRRDRNLKAIMELEIRLDRPFIRNRLDQFVPGIIKSMERHEAYNVDLTNPDAPEDLQKLMSAGKRLIYEATREDQSAIDPAIELLSTHFDHQPEDAIYADRQQLKQIVPDKLDRLDLTSGREGNCGPESDLNSDQTPVDSRETSHRTGCGCFGSTLSFLLLLSAISMVLWVV